MFAAYFSNLAEAVFIFHFAEGQAHGTPYSVLPSDGDNQGAIQFTLA